jgi:hypothetical protein
LLVYTFLIVLAADNAFMAPWAMATFALAMSDSARRPSLRFVQARVIPANYATYPR